MCTCSCVRRHRSVSVLAVPEPPARTLVRRVHHRGRRISTSCETVTEPPWVGAQRNEHVPSSSSTTLAPSPTTFHPSDRKSTRLNSSHVAISYAVFCLKKKNKATEAKTTAHEHERGRRVSGRQQL